MKGVKEYTEKILSHIPELDPDIEVVKLIIPEYHVHMAVVIPPRITVTNAIQRIKTELVKSSSRNFLLYKNLCKERWNLVNRIPFIVYSFE